MNYLNVIVSLFVLISVSNARPTDPTSTKYTEAIFDRVKIIENFFENKMDKDLKLKRIVYCTLLDPHTGYCEPNEIDVRRIIVVAIRTGAEHYSARDRKKTRELLKYIEANRPVDFKLILKKYYKDHNAGDQLNHLMWGLPPIPSTTLTPLCSVVSPQPSDDR